MKSKFELAQGWFRKADSDLANTGKGHDAISGTTGSKTMTETVFLRLLAYDDKATALSEAVIAIKGGG